MTDALTDNILVLVRHGESEWNKLNLFTGWRNPDLTEKGVIEARVAGRMIRDHRVKFDIAFTSVLKRAQHTLDIILSELSQPDVPIIRDAALNERDYGALSGLNKDEARKKWGEAQVQTWRRSYDVAPPDGESLKDTLDRVRPYYDSAIWPQITASKNVDHRGTRQFASFSRDDPRKSDTGRNPGAGACHRRSHFVPARSGRPRDRPQGPSSGAIAGSTTRGPYRLKQS